MTAEPHFDPTTPLTGAPEPWAYAPAPTRREGPPYHLTEMIAAEPSVAGRLIDRVGASASAAALADAIRASVQAGYPIVVTGCGTSETGGMGIVEILREALAAAGSPDAVVLSEQALEVALDPPARGL